MIKIDRKVLIAWIESEGSISIYNKKNTWNPRLSIQIAQKDMLVIHNILKLVGFGELVMNNSQCNVVRWRKLSEVKEVLNFITQDYDDWLGCKVEKAKAALKFIELREKRNKGKDWSVYELNECKKLIDIISPKHHPYTR